MCEISESDILWQLPYKNEQPYSAHLSDTVLKNPLEFEQRQMGENWGFIWYTYTLLFFCEMRE